MFKDNNFQAKAKARDGSGHKAKQQVFSPQFENMLLQLA